MAHPILPVSYTHLDVYKRQVYDYALRICDGTSSNVVKTYTKAELDQLPKKKAEAYSSYNSYNTYQAIEEAEGPDVRDILAGAGYPADKLDPKSLIRFGAYDGLLLPYIVEDLFGTRYHYPHAKDCINGKVNAAALKDRVEVPVLIDFGYENDNRLCFGQLSPNEQSLTYSVKYMLGGKIIVNAGTPSTIAGGIKANIASGSTIQPGQEIKLSKAKMTSDPIYYTTDGKEPTRMSDLYNYNNYSNASLRLNKIKAPAKAGKFVVKARVMQYGRKPSPVQTFTYTVKPLPAKGKTFQVGTAKYKICLLYTSKQEDFEKIEILASDGYEIKLMQDFLKENPIIVTFGIDGKPLDQESAPLRIIIPESDSAYWIRKVNQIKFY